MQRKANQCTCHEVATAAATVIPSASVIRRSVLNNDGCIVSLPVVVVTTVIVTVGLTISILLSMSVSIVRYIITQSKAAI